MSKFPKRYGNGARWAKRQLIRSHGTDCGICERPILTMKDITLDHIFPRAKGGTDELENLQLAHDNCNQSKRDMTMEEYRAWQNS